MNYLIDTHILLWWLADDLQLSKNIRNIIKSEPIYVSTAAVWEIIIKKNIGKLEIPGDLDEQLQRDFDLVVEVKAHQPCNYNIQSSKLSHSKNFSHFSFKRRVYH